MQNCDAKYAPSSYTPQRDIPDIEARHDDGVRGALRCAVHTTYGNGRLIRGTHRTRWNNFRPTPKKIHAACQIQCRPGRACMHLIRGPAEIRFRPMQGRLGLRGSEANLGRASNEMHAGPYGPACISFQARLYFKLFLNSPPACNDLNFEFLVLPIPKANGPI